MTSLPQLPLVFDATPATVLSEALDMIETTKRIWDEICANVTADRANFDNVILPLLLDENSRLNKTLVIRFYARTARTRTFRNAATEAKVLLDNAYSKIFSRNDMYELAKAVDGIALDAETKHYLSRLVRRFTGNGCDIQDEKTRAKFSCLSRELKEVTKKIDQNLRSSKGGLWLTEEELDGIPSSMLQIGFFTNGSRNEGQYWIPNRRQDSTPVLQCAKREETRKRVFYAVNNAIPENTDLFRQLVLLRDETARMLGYAHYLDQMTSRRTAQSLEAVLDFTRQLRERLSSAAMQSAEELLLIKAEDINAGNSSGDATKIFLWDEEFYARKQGNLPSLEESWVSQYFEVHHTVDAILKFYGRCFETRFDRVFPDEQHHMLGGKPLTWHEDVVTYSVWDTRPRGGFLGYAYFDLFCSGSTYTHRGHYAMQWSYNDGDGVKHYPSSALVMYLSKPTPTKPTLLSMRELRILFRELGHLHHSLLTETKYAYLHQIHRDFARVPRVMFEQFLWQGGLIKELSLHYSWISPQMRDVWVAHRETETDEEPPAQLTDGEVAALTRRDRRSLVREELSSLSLALYDILVHAPASHDHLVNMNLCEEFNKLQTTVKGLQGGEACGDGWRWSHGESMLREISWTHGGGYYAYIFGKVWGLDMMNTYLEGDRENKDAGRRFRDLVLAPGGSQPELQTFRDFVGREPNLDAFFRWLGL